jgi:hypothetical protein
MMDRMAIKIKQYCMAIPMGKPTRTRTTAKYVYFTFFFRNER